MRVLIAEDDYLVSEEITQALIEKGYDRVGVASNGIKAVEMVRNLRPDVVLMDIQMPKMDGLEATKLIQKECPFIITCQEPLMLNWKHNSKLASNTPVMAF